MPAAHLVMYLVAGLTCPERLPETGGCWHLAGGAAGRVSDRRPGRRRLRRSWGLRLRAANGPGPGGGLASRFCTRPPGNTCSHGLAAFWTAARHVFGAVGDA